MDAPVSTALRAARQAIRAAHRDTTHHIVADMLRDLDRQFFLAAFNLNGVQKLGQLAIFKSNIQYRADDLHHGTGCFL